MVAARLLTDGFIIAENEIVLRSEAVVLEIHNTNNGGRAGYSETALQSKLLLFVKYTARNVNVS